MIYVGDIHGKFLTFIELIKNCQNETIIQVGDIGVGFVSDIYDHLDIINLKRLSDCLVENHCLLYVVRGNHDNPAYWSGGASDYPNICFVDDYTKLTIEGKVVLFVGGGISLDRKSRIPDVSWWKNETIKRIPKNFDCSCDILVTHVPTPMYFAKIPSSIVLDYWLTKDEKLAKDLISERKLIEKIYSQSNCKWWVSGHFHQSDRNYTEQCNFINLDELEIFEIREDDER